MSRYKINILTLQNSTLTFTVSKYTISEGSFVEFVDEKTGKHKRFHASRCEIEEVSDNDR
jgi:hypothetical protein